MAPDSGGATGSEGWYTVRYAQYVLSQPPPPEAAQHGFTVDPERAQEAIDRLDEVIERLLRWLVGGGPRLNFAAPAEDEVSVNLARNGELMARRCEAGVRTWANQLQAFRDGLQTQLDTYRQAEQDAVDRLR